MMRGRAASRWLPAAVLAALCALAAPAQAQVAPTGAYCEPAPGTRLLYSNRAYEIEQKLPDAPRLYYTYRILAPALHSQFVERRSQLLFDDGEDRWFVLNAEQEMQDFWPLQAGKQLTLHRENRANRTQSDVSFQVIGPEAIDGNGRTLMSWKIERHDRNSDGSVAEQVLWYAPELCTLAAFTDSQKRTIRLLRVLKPGDKDYDRPLEVREHRLYFADKNELVK